MTAGKAVSRLICGDARYQPTISKLISHGWFEFIKNDIVPTMKGEILMIGIITRLWMHIEFPEYKSPRIDAVHASAIFTRMNDMGLINSHEINGEQLVSLSDEGAQVCIKLVTNEDNAGEFDSMMEFCEEERLGKMTFTELNTEGKKRRRMSK